MRVLRHSPADKVVFKLQLSTSNSETESQNVSWSSDTIHVECYVFLAIMTGINI